MQSKEELEKCIKEQVINKDVSLPKTDDLVDEVSSLNKHAGKPRSYVSSQTTTQCSDRHKV